MKKVLLFVVAFCMLFNTFAMCSFAAEDVTFSFSEMQAIIKELGDKLASADAVDRSKGFVLAKSYLSTNDGVDTLIGIVEADEFTASNPLVEAIHKVLGDITSRKEQFIFMLKFAKCFTEEERVAVLDAFYAREDMGFDSDVDAQVGNIFKYFNTDLTIGSIDEGNDVTGAMIASLFKIFDGHLMLTDTKRGSSDFELDYISNTFEGKLDELLNEYTVSGESYNASALIESIIGDANEIIPDDIKDDIKDVFRVVGIYTPKKASSGSSSGTNSSPTVVIKPSTPTTPSTGTTGSTINKNDMSQYGTRVPGIILSPNDLLDKIINESSSGETTPDVGEKPGTEEPGTEIPGTQEPGTEQPGTTPGTGTGTGTGTGSGAGTGSAGTAVIDGFDDCDNHWSDGVTTYLKYRKILKGDYGTNNYRPDSRINREEMAAIIVRYIELREDFKIGKADYASFADASDISPWALDSIVYLTDAGILKGYPDGNFKPKQEITREEAIAIISRVLDNKYRPQRIAADYADHNDIGEWARWDVYYVSSLGIASGYSTGEFLPKNNITRAEVASLIYNKMCVEGVIR